MTTSVEIHCVAGEDSRYAAGGMRVPELDGIRGLAILLVLCNHYIFDTGRFPLRTPMAYVARSLELSWSGVDLFFVLSGFLLGGILLDQKETSNYFRVFYLRRAYRILPLYFLVFGLFLLAQIFGLARSSGVNWMFREHVPNLSYLTFTQNIFMALNHTRGSHWLTMTWSLAVEEQFYLVLPFMIRFIRTERLPWVFLVCCCIAVLLRVTVPGVPPWPRAADVLMPWRADSLFCGALLAYISRRCAGAAGGLKPESRLLLRIAFGILLLGAAGMTYSPDLFGPFDKLWLAVLYAILIWLVIGFQRGALASMFRFRPLVKLGIISYGLYMYHVLALDLLHGFLIGGPPAIRTSFRAASVSLLALCISLAISWISFEFFEKPFLSMGHRLKYKRERKLFIA
jgi:peptidoglycan/LPS O-acetylase OafA/YrhL